MLATDETVQTGDHGVRWLRGSRRDIVVSPLGERVANLLDWWQAGIYYFDAGVLFHKRVDWSHERHIELVFYGQMSSCDKADLTALVVAAHDLCIRVQVEGAANGYLRLSFSPREREGTCFSDHHPRLEDNVRRIRAGWGR